MVWIAAIVAFVATVQSVVWIGGSRVGARRRAQGAIVAPIALLSLLACLLHLLVPGFFVA